MESTLCGWTLAALAAAGAAAPQTITETDFLAGIQQNPAAVALGGELGAARARRAGAAGFESPTLAFTHEDVAEEPRESLLEVAWTPPWDPRRRLGMESTQAGVEAASGRLDTARLALRLEMAAAYAEWAFAEERLELHAAHAELVDELGRHLDERAAAGEASGLAARRLALAAVVARAELARAEAGLARTRAAALGWRPDLDRELRPELPELPASPDEPDLSGRRDLAARRAELEQARIEARLAGRLITAPELRLGWKELRDASTVADGPVLGLAWRLPIAGRRRAARLSSSAQLTTAEAELALGEATAQAELQGSRDAYAGLRRAALATAGTDVALIVRAARSAYRLGESDTTDLLDTLRSVLAAELARLDLHAAALGARRDLEAALGRPLVRWTEFGQRPKSRSESAFASNCGQ